MVGRDDRSDNAALFMLVTTPAALISQGVGYLKAGSYMLEGISLELVALATPIVSDARRALLAKST